MNPVRTRFAPSPTGKLHLGGLRTALFSYLYAKKHNGKFIYRVEDTDKSREIYGSADSMERDLKWLGMLFDEGPRQGGPFGPYTQSQRLDIYKKHAEVLLEKKIAYRCFCSEERLQQLRATSTDETRMYDRLCLRLSPEEVQDRVNRGEPHVVRLRIPPGSTQLEDVVRGRIEFQNKQVDDPVLVKSDQFPTYHFAHVIDDHLMEISHVIRGEEWINSSPKHVILYDAFGWKKPHFAHVPLILNDDRSKLSKRQNDITIESYKEQGYAPEAVINFVAMLGWSPEDSKKELYTMNELINDFTLERIHKSGAVYQNAKLLWFSENHFKRNVEVDLPGVINKLKPMLNEKFKTVKGQVDKKDDAYMGQVLKVIAGRLQKLTEVPDKAVYFWVDPEIGKSNDFYNKMWSHTKASDKEMTQQMIDQLDPIAEENWNLESITNALGKVAEMRGLVPGQIYKPARYLLTGLTIGATVPETMEVFGKKLTLHRLQRGMTYKEKEW